MTGRELATRAAVVAIAGAAGAVARWVLGAGVASALGTKYPYGTLMANVVGCLVFGFVYVWTEGRGVQTEWLRLAVLTGFAGAFTTFSTLAFDTQQLALRSGGYGLSAGNLALHVILGLGALLVGMSAARQW